MDDDAAVRRSIGWLLLSADYEAIPYETPAAALAAAADMTAGCVLLDVRMPGMSGLELQVRLKERGVRLPMIFLTAQGDIPTAVSAMKAGAVDFIEKPFDGERLLAAIAAALDMELEKTWLSNAADAAHRIRTLSPRERSVLDALIAGHANKEIAYQLGISVRTVEAHRARMLDRLGVRTLAEAVRLAVIATLVSGAPS